VIYKHAITNIVMDQTIVAMICLTILEALALMQGLNGGLFEIVIIIIAGLGGWELHKVRKGENPHWSV
jgi:hypothetical protein